MAMLLVLGAAAVAYTAGVRNLARRGRRWPVPRTLAFAGAVVVLAVLELPPVAGADGDSFTAHVLEHLAMGMVAPLLLALSALVTLALQASSRSQGRALRRILDSRAVAVVTHPVVATIAFVGSMFALYLTPLLEISVEQPAVHALVHLHFLLAGCVFFWPLVSPDPVPRRLPYPARILLVLLTVPAHAVVGVTLVASTALVAPDVYGSLDAQHTAGGVLWATGDLLGLAVAAVILAQWMGADERQAARDDRRPAGSPVLR